MESTTRALKEWAVAVDALEEGKTIMLLRKGGIKEEGNRFKVAGDRVLLYPTYEHQQSNLLKPDYCDRVKPVESGWHPETVRIGAWANITDILLVSDKPTIEALSLYHIWNEKFVSDRLKWKPQVPLYLLLLRTYRLDKAHIIPYNAEYGGCKSWIDLNCEIDINTTQPVLDESEYTQQVTKIRQLCQLVQSITN